MARRRFRYDREQGCMVEIVDRTDEHHFIRGEIDAFRAPDGTIIDSRTKYDDYCARNNVVPTAELSGLQKSVDRYEQSRQDRALRELLWEKVDKASRGRRVE
jgi:hypothetical protein